MEAALQEVLRSVADEEPSIAALDLWRIDPAAVSNAATAPPAGTDEYHQWVSDRDALGDWILDAVVQVVVRDLM
jgi:hypothetical protein